MGGDALLEEFAIVLLDDSRTRLELFDEWLPGVSVRYAERLGELSGTVDGTCAVAVLSQRLLGDDEERVRKAIVTRNPYCQLVLVLPRPSFVSPLEDSYDAVLRRPVFRDELQETVERRFMVGVYSSTLDEYYHLNTELAGRTLEPPDAEGTGEDSTPGETPDWLVDRYRVLEERLELLESALDFEAIHAVIESFQLHERYLTEPEDDADTAVASKYHPDRCPKCKLPWGVDHRNKLGKGFERAGAYVWKCARCGKLVHGVGTSHRRVTGR